MYKKNYLLAILFSVVALLTSCEKDSSEIDPDNPDNPIDSKYPTGWNQSSEDLSKFPRQISYNFSSSGNSEKLPAKIDLTDKLPPVGNQGQYGTCVVWSVGYGMHTYLNAVNSKLTKQQLTDKNNQSSPADLWMAMDNSKGADCGGATFEPAFEVLVNRGVATLQTAPYSSLKCGGAPSQSWTSDASGRKIKNYRMIAENDMTVANLKTQLSQGQLISIGAKLGDNFMEWGGSGVLSSETYLQPVTQHARHALCIAGYDDSKGSKGAFLVYNSWGTSWGNQGFIWVDYDFFVKEFVFCAFVATGDNNVKPNDDNKIDPKELTSGADLAAYHAFDLGSSQSAGCNRQIQFNIYNSGTSNIPSSNRWSVIYLYYNAFNANDYGILANLYFTNEIPKGQIKQAQQNVPSFSINKDIPSGRNIAAAVFDMPYEYLLIDYYLPPITGYYYFVVLADPYNNVAEANEQNNNFFIANANGLPYYLQNGVPLMTRSGEQEITSEETPLYSPVTQENANAYTPEEIRNMIINHKKSGEFDVKIRSFEEKQIVTRIGGK